MICAEQKLDRGLYLFSVIRTLIMFKKQMNRLSQGERCAYEDIPLRQWSCHKTGHYINITFFTGWHGRLSPPRKHCRPRRSRGWQCFSRGDDLPCHPVKNVIFILLYRMSPFPTQLQFYVIKLLYAPGDIFIECHPLLRMPLRPPLFSQFEPYAHIFAHVTFF